MIQTGFDSRVKVQQVIESQLPEFVRSDFPKYVDFLKQYYISQEYQGGPVDIAENLDQYLKIDNITPEVRSGTTSLTSSITESSSTIPVISTKGYPSSYGLLKIDDEIITYTGLTTNTFTGCIRGFSAITEYNSKNDPGELVFTTSNASSHNNSSTVTNLSALFLKEFYDKIRYSFAPGLEKVEFTENLDVSNFIKQSRDFYQAKGTPESFKILFKILYNEEPKVIDLEQYLLKASSADLNRKEIVIAERISGNPLNLLGQTVRRTLDTSVESSVSAVEILTRGNKTYYKLALFVGYDEDIPQGSFAISGKTRVLKAVNTNSTVISVDSTIGFPESGTIISGNNTITYTSKSVNQFFGCSGIIQPIPVASDIRSSETIFGYENGDLNKKVELRLTGVLSSFIPESDEFIAKEGEKIFVKNIGEIIENPESDKSYKEIFANSLIYNTSCRYEVSNINGSIYTLLSTIDESSLKVGDYVDILFLGSQDIVVANVQVLNIDKNLKQVQLASSVPDPSKKYDLRRRLNYATSNGANILGGNGEIISSVQNLYVDNQYAYIASNSLPNYNVSKKIIESTIPSALGSPFLSSIGQGYIQGFDEEKSSYSIISFDVDTDLQTGDSIIYESDNNSLVGLIDGREYFVQVDPQNQGFKTQIRLYPSRSFVGTESYITFIPPSSNDGIHRFILSENSDKNIGAQRLLRKFPLSQNISRNVGEDIGSGGVGLLINGVEIASPKSDNKIYYGPLTNVTVFNGGNGYDVVRLPELVVDSPISLGSTDGTIALSKAVVRGNVKDVYVDPQDFEISEVVSVVLSGGNGSGAVFEPIVTQKFREVEFDARPTLSGGGIDLTEETITFKEDHKFVNGQEIIYNPNGNSPLGISTYFKSPLPSSISNAFDRTLVNGSRYYVGWVNPKTIRLYETEFDFSVGINTVGITTENTSGVHKFRTLPKKVLQSIKVINPGSGYENRQLYVKSSGISSATNTITFKNHNFNHGDIVLYNYTKTPISGLSSDRYYKIIRNDENTFQLANAGLVSIGATISEDFDRKKYVRFSSTGIGTDPSDYGYHIFKYPDISLSVTVSYGSSITGIITATPVVTGSIVDAYLYEEGSNYGSSILNLEKTPNITIKTGKNAEVRPTIVDGKIVQVDVLSKGVEYYSTPEIRVEGSGTGAILRPVIINNKLENVIVVNSGIGYSNSNTSLRVIPRGTGAFIKTNIRPLSLNKQFRTSDEILVNGNGGLKYSWVGYSPTLGVQEFEDSLPSQNPLHSPIIGWAYDGNPIYGPYGYSQPNESQFTRLLNSGYVLDPNSVKNRPSLQEFPAGYFVDDYIFNDSGDLDIHNGRYGKTPEFPDGVYAYFAGIQTNVGSNTLQPRYPFFIGNNYKSPKIKENEFLDQSFDFNNSNLSRNTFPYKVSSDYAGNDFIIESNELINQISVVKSISRGSVDSIDIIESGKNYKINDKVLFESSDVGGGLDAIVSSLEGVDVESVKTNIETYTNSIVEWKDPRTVKIYTLPYHTLTNLDTVVISGLSMVNTKISKNHVIGFSSDRTFLQQHLPSNSVAGFVTDIYVSRIPNSLSVGSTLRIENEFLSVLNIFRNDAVLRVKRSDVGAAHTETTEISILANSFDIAVNTDYFASKPRDKVYFNPHESVGIGTTPGIGINKSYRIGNVYTPISVQTQSIYLPNHPFRTGQRVLLGKSNSKNPLAISTTPGSTAFHWPEDGEDTSAVYIINQSKDYIGFSTIAGISSSPVYITNQGSNAYDYYFESQEEQTTCQVQRITTTVGLNTYHKLQNGEEIKLIVQPNISVGIGTTSSSIKVFYDADFEKLILNFEEFNNGDVNSDQNSITLPNHGLKTGDKILYKSTSPINGLVNGEYYVYGVDINTIKLCETILDVKKEIPNIIGISSSGSGHKIGLINPQIKSYKNTNIVFDTSDSSLSNYKLKFFYDSDLKNEFVSVASTSVFNVSYGSSLTSVTLNYSDDLPPKLFYGLEKSGYISTSDKTVQFGSEILFTDSVYNNTYKISGVVGSSSTIFNINVNGEPERYSYLSSECDVLKYTTKSKTVTGGIAGIDILFPGFGYKNIPIFKSVQSDSGNGASLLPRSRSIGNINNVQILEQGFEYASDKTLRPQAAISPIIIVKDSYNLDKVNITFGGRNYFSPPKLILVDADQNLILDDNNLEPVVASGSISDVKILSPINGISLDNHRVIAVDNSNGVFISSISQSGNDITCILSTPITGFSTDVFSIGEEIFVEGIEKDSPYGTGFNSKDYNYRFFKVKSYVNTVPATVTFDLSNLTTNPGFAKSAQSGFGAVVSKSNYPTFTIEQSPSLFLNSEPLLVDTGSGFIQRDSIVSETNPGFFKIIGPYVPSTDDIVRGKYSGVQARVSEVIENSGKFGVSFSNISNLGWNDDVGKLNVSNQTTPDNDYYQNLSYSIRSSIEYEKMITSVNSLLHPSGLKNFSDTQIENSVIVDYDTVTNDIILLDIIEDKRVDTINNFDLVSDIYTVGGKSRFIKLENKTLSDYFLCLSNRVLKIDDFGPKFLNRESLTQETDVITDTIVNPYQQYLVQISDPISKETQLTEVVVLYNGASVFTLEKATLVTKNEKLGDIQGVKDDADNVYLGISPADLFDTDYDFKILKQKFISEDNTGIGTQSVGFVDLTSSNNFIGVSTNSITGIATIFSTDVNKIKSAYFNIFIKNVVKNKLYYSEVFLDHDSSNTYISDFSFDTSTGFSTSLPGSFDADIVSGNLILKYTNLDSNGVLVQSNVIGFGTTAVGIGTYRFKETLQLDGTERSSRFETLVSSGISTTNVIQLNTVLDSAVKSVIRVSYGNTSALHQVMMTHDENDSYTVQYPFLSIGSTSGIGTFGSEIDGSNVIMKFYPDQNIGESVEINSFNEILYRDFDLSNLPPTLEYGTSSYEVILSQYNAINGERREALAFDANNFGIPIFEKQFTPYNSSQVDPVTGIIKIQSHFFQTGEELIYTPTSTFPGLPASSIGIGNTLNSVGIVTNVLPNRVYAIKVSEDELKLSTRRDYAFLGIGVTITSFGQGNAHLLEMVKKDEKCIISINGVVQKPLTFTPIAYNLNSNPNAKVSVGQTFISLSGIATIRSKDLLKVNNEYMKIVNVGLAETISGPIVGFGTYKLAEVRRGSVGTAESTHDDGSIARIYRGAFTVSGRKVYFTDPPKGNANQRIGQNNLIAARDQFSGRVYLRQDYTKNVIYDDISDQFTGIGQTFEITVQGISTSGIETGSGVVFINDIYQTPTTSNNAGNNYFYGENAGKTLIQFTGISSSNGDLIISDFDINQNQLPRGGVVVALGSTNGLGFAPLVGAKVKASVGAAGSITNIVSIAYTGTGKNVSTATYNNSTGIAEITTITPHELVAGDSVKLIGLGFTTASSGIVTYLPPSGLSGSYGVAGIVSARTFTAFIGYSTSTHFYVGMGTIFPWYNLNYGSGYRQPVSIAITDSSHTGSAANISAIVGAGGTLSFVINDGGSGYSTSTVQIDIEDPSYENLPVIGVSRVATGATTECGKGLLVSLEVGASSTTGIGSTLFEVTSFKITRPGYSFEIGDVIKPIGLVTALGLSSPVREFELTVTDIFDDSFSSWQFGELDFIDSIALLQDGRRTRFPLYYNSQLLSIETDPNVLGSSDIDLSSVLLIFINGVIQEPNVAYNFSGGTSFTFSDPPGPDAKISIYFYRGTRGVDSKLINITETIKNGDIVQVYGSTSYPFQQDNRIVYNISSSDVIETNVYSGIGVTEDFTRPLYWTKQKVDRFINGDPVYKSRDSLETQIYPSAKVIYDVKPLDTEIFVDDAAFFKYEQDKYGITIDSFNLLLQDSEEPRSASLSASINSGEVTTINILDGGSGYDVASLPIKFAKPPSLDYPGNIGIGSTATGIAYVTSGIVTFVTITSPGYGYTVAPQVLVPTPTLKTELLTDIDGSAVSGFSGIITGITTTSGFGGHPLALKFFLQRKDPSLNFSELLVNYPIYIRDTNVGNGITSVDFVNSDVIGISTNFVDNIYRIHSITRDADRAFIICNIESGSNIVGIATTGTREYPIGKFSWGKLGSITRNLTNPVSIGVTGLIIDSGLSTFPTAQRRGFGLRDLGAIRKISTVKNVT